MPVPVRVVKVLAGGALVEFTDGSTRLVVTETVAAWRRFGLAVNEGMMLNPDEVALYKRIVEEFPRYSGLQEEEVEAVPEVTVDEPEVAAPVVEEELPFIGRVKELYTDIITPPEEDVGQIPPYTGHFGTSWLPQFGENLKWGWNRYLQDAKLREEERLANQETRIEILDKEPDNVELEKLVTEIVEGRPVY